MKYLNKIGCEVEGAVSRGCSRKKRDGSLYGFSQKDISEKKLYVGEIASRPHSNLGRLKFWLKQVYPKLTNSTCGFHIHVSFKHDKYRDFLSRDCVFHDYFLGALRRWARGKKMSREFFARLNGRNEYCHTTYGYYRIGAICFRTCHNTIEFRIFSQVMPVETAYKCLDFVRDTVENYLEQNYHEA